MKVVIEEQQLELLLRAGDRLAHELSYGTHKAELEMWWKARGHGTLCSVCCPNTLEQPVVGAFLSSLGVESRDLNITG